MAFVPVSHACAIEVRQTLVNVSVEFTLGFALLDDYTSADLIDIADKVAVWWYDIIRPWQRVSTVHREVYARSLHSLTGPVYTSLLYTTETGTASGSDPVPNNSAFCVSFRTAGRGRANRGRNYFYGMQENNLTGGNEVAAGYRAAIIAAYETLLPGGSYDPTPHRWCVISRQLNGTPIGRAVPITAVTASSIYVRTMRTRLPD